MTAVLLRCASRTTFGRRLGALTSLVALIAMSSVLDNISSVNLLESLITNDARWSWILDEWKASNDAVFDATQRDLAKRVNRFRENFVSETPGLVAKLLGDIEGPDDDCQEV